MSVDGISAYDVVSRRAMLEGFRSVHGGAETLPFVRMFHSSPSRHLWEDQEGVVHTIDQGEGGEQGDPPMPLLFSLGQHGALESVQRSFRDGERMLAYLDDIYIVTSPDRVGVVIASLQEQLFRHARIRLHGGKTQVWNRAGIRPVACDVLEQIASQTCQWSHRASRCWETPLGHPEFVASHLEHIAEEHRVLLERIPAVQDVQSAWLILLHCAVARANYLLRVGLHWSEGSQRTMMQGCGDVCVKYCTSRKISVKPQQGLPAQCLWCWVGPSLDGRRAGASEVPEWKWCWGCTFHGPVQSPCAD